MADQTSARLPPSKLKAKADRRSVKRFQSAVWKYERPSAAALQARAEYLATIAERPLSISQRLFGDPLPGRSALEQKGK